MPTIDVLLATYNGARYLPEQLRSLKAQTFADWRLVVRDDGSSDGSLDLVRDWAARTGRALRVIEDGRKGLGACGNFAALLEASDAPYFAFCDQDDSWLPEKLELMLDRLQAVEARRGAVTPLLAYSDLRVVDGDLLEIHPSFRAYAPLAPPRPGRVLEDIMTQNVVTGCASLGNAALRRAALPISSDSVMHDWWLALVAAGLGELVDVPEATIRYRQHGANAIGAVRWTAGAAAYRLAIDFGGTMKTVRSFIVETQRQALALHARYADRLDADTAELLRRYARLFELSFWQRKRFYLGHLMKPGRVLRTVALLLFI